MRPLTGTGVAATLIDKAMESFLGDSPALMHPVAFTRRFVTGRFCDYSELNLTAAEEGSEDPTIRYPEILSIDEDGQNKELTGQWQ